MTVMLMTCCLTGCESENAFVGQAVETDEVPREFMQAEKDDSAIRESPEEDESASAKHGLVQEMYAAV